VIRGPLPTDRRRTQVQPPLGQRPTGRRRKGRQPGATRGAPQNGGRTRVPTPKWPYGEKPLVEKTCSSAHVLAGRAGCRPRPARREAAPPAFRRPVAEGWRERGVAAGGGLHDRRAGSRTTSRWYRQPLPANCNPPSAARGRSFSWGHQWATIFRSATLDARTFESNSRGRAPWPAGPRARDAPAGVEGHQRPVQSETPGPVCPGGEPPPPPRPAFSHDQPTRKSPLRPRTLRLRYLRSTRRDAELHTLRSSRQLSPLHVSRRNETGPPICVFMEGSRVTTGWTPCCPLGARGRPPPSRFVSCRYPCANGEAPGLRRNARRRLTRQHGPPLAGACTRSGTTSFSTRRARGPPGMPPLGQLGLRPRCSSTWPAQHAVPDRRREAGCPGRSGCPRSSAVGRGASGCARGSPSRRPCPV